MSDHVSLLTVGTVPDLYNHAAMRSLWESSTSETLRAAEPINTFETSSKSVRQVETYRAWLYGMKVHVRYPVYRFAWQA